MACKLHYNWCKPGAKSSKASPQLGCSRKAAEAAEQIQQRTKKYNQEVLICYQ